MPKYTKEIGLCIFIVVVLFLGWKCANAPIDIKEPGPPTAKDFEEARSNMNSR